MMSTAKINDWLQVVGIFGVIASLIFVGLQMNQAQEIAVSNSYQARTAIEVESTTSVMNSPQYLSGMSKLYARKIEDLTSQEAIALNHQLATALMMIENNHFQYQSGFLSEEHWQRNLNELKCTFELPFYREMLFGFSFRDSFLLVLKDVINQSINDPSGCWDIEWKYSIE